MSGKKISDIELHAFIDGELDADRLPEIKAEIETDSALAERIEAFRDDKEMLRRVYAPLVRRPIPMEWVALARRPNIPVRPTLSWRMVGSIAAVIILTLAGTFGYWEMQAPTAGEIVQTALDARGSAAPAGGVIDVKQGTNIHQYDATLSAAVALDVKAPDMTRLGYQLVEIRLYRGARDGGAAELFYRDRAGRLFTLYLRHSDGTVRFDQFTRDGLRVCVWQDEEVGTVMAGNVSTADMQRLASLAYTGLTL